MYNIYLITIAISLISLILRRRHFFDIYPYLLALLSFAFFAEMTRKFGSAYLSKLVHYPYTMIELTLMGLIYQKKLNGILIKKYISWYIFLAWIIVVLVVFVSGLEVGDEIDTFLSHCFIVALSIKYFYQLFKAPYDGKHVMQDTFFWINCANLFFYAGAFIQQTTGAVYQTYPLLERQVLYYISSIFNIALYAIYTFAFLCRKSSD